MNFNKTLLISIAIFFAIGFVMGTQLHGCKGNSHINSDRKTIHSDTVVQYVQRTDTMYRHIATYVPVPVRTTDHGPLTTDSSDSVVCRLSSVDRRPSSVDRRPSSVVYSDTAVYSDSIYRAHEFKAVIYDIITGNRIAQRSVQWADLAPTEVRTITKTITVDKKQPIIKVYLGASAGVRYASPLTQGGIDVAPTGSVIISDRYMIDLGYYVLGGEITAGVKVKLSFTK
jgi:hypothetical protein